MDLFTKIQSRLTEVTKTTRKWRTEAFIGDGIYDVSEVEFVQISGSLNSVLSDTKERFDGVILNNEMFKNKYNQRNLASTKEIESFVEKYPDFFLANAYETGTSFLLNAEPSRVSISRGSGFSYGSTNILTGCPKRVLILAQND